MKPGVDSALVPTTGFSNISIRGRELVLSHARGLNIQDTGDVCGGEIAVGFTHHVPF